VKRREFIKVSSLLGAGAAASPAFLLGGCAAKPLPGTGTVSTTPTICDMCFWKCAGNVYKEDGELWKITGNPDDLHSAGRLCTRGTGGPGAYLDRDRLKQPLMRVIVDGKQTFRETSWDVALDFIAEKMRAIAATAGPERMLMLNHGAGSSHFRHLLRAYGSDSRAEPAFAQCRGPRDVGFRLTFGESASSPERTDMANSRCIVLIGSHIGENLHNGQVQTLAEALNRGVTLITVDPRFSVPASKSKYWLPIKPGTDMALLLAWMNVLITEELYDKDFVERHTVGFDELARHVRAYTPEWVYLETGIKPEVIRQTAREMAKAAPATVVHPGRHAVWYGDDTQRSRAVAMLNALLGSWNREGGFFIPEKVSLPEYPLPAYPKPKAKTADAYPGKWPFAGQGVTNGVIDASIGEDAFFKGWLVYGTNLPQTIPGVADKLEAAANSLDLVVVVETMPSEMTGYADVILPECTYLERYDDLRNSAERHPSLALRMPAFEPKYDSKPGWWIAKQLGKRLDLDEYFPWEDYSEKLDWQLRQVGSSLEELQKIGVKNFPRKRPLYMPENERVVFRTPSRKIEFYSKQLADKGFDPMPVYTPPWVNPLVANEWSLKNGDYVRLGGTNGVVSNRVRIRVTERIGPDSVFMAHGFGHKSKRLRLAAGVGADDSELMGNIKIDPIMGGTGMRANFVTFVKERA
jgi:thiosulfate reductase/polysulfide reductase chain A